jgi:hypothetical protein
MLNILGGHERIILKIINKEKRGQKPGMNVILHGCEEQIWMEEKDIPLVIVEQLNSLGSISHHTEVSLWHTPPKCSQKNLRNNPFTKFSKMTCIKCLII